MPLVKSMPAPLVGDAPLACAAGLRIALFSGNYNYVREGANNALNRLVEHLLDRGASVRVYSPTSRTPAFAPVGDLVSVPSVPLPVRSEFRIALGMPAAIRLDVERFAPNIVHVSTPDLLGTAALRFARRSGVASVASLHTVFETYLEHYRLGALRDWAWRRQRDYYRQADRVLAPNAPMAAHLRTMGVSDDRIRLWGRGIDHAQFTSSRRNEAWRAAHGFAPDEAVVCFFGRVVREKGLAVFATTITALRARGHQVRPLVIGTGPALGEFRDLMGETVFAGHLDGAALGRAVASADILLNPSTTEAFGNVNLEALAAGLAVVSADVGSARAVIDDGETGLLCPNHPSAFADAVESLIVDPNRRRGFGRRGAVAAAAARWPAVNDAAVRAYRELVFADGR